MGILTKHQNATPARESNLTKNEVDFLLRHIASVTFDGKDVLILSSIVKKLQTQTS